MRVLDLASGVGDPALSIAEEVGPSGRVTATDLGPGMMSLAEELARKKGLPTLNSERPAPRRFRSPVNPTTFLRAASASCFFRTSQSASRMSPRAKARRARRVRGLGQERAALLHDHSGSRSKARSGASAATRSRRPESLHVRRARPAPPRTAGRGFNNVHEEDRIIAGAGRRRSKSTGAVQRSRRALPPLIEQLTREKWLKPSQKSLPR